MRIAAASAAGSSGATSRPEPPCSTTSGRPPTRVATTGETHRVRLHQRDRQALVTRGEAEDVRRGEEIVDVVAETQEAEPVAEAEAVVSGLQLVDQWALPNAEEHQIRSLRHCPGRGFEQYVVSLFRTKIRHGDNHDRSAVDPQLGAGRRRGAIDGRPPLRGRCRG